MHEIWIIGTNPPCPRCGLLTHLIEALVSEKEKNKAARVRHLAYTDPEASDFSHTQGLIPGTAKDVARLLDDPIDAVLLNQCYDRRDDPETLAYEPYNQFGWTYALDQYLQPYEQAAKGVGILMTPVLIINGQLKHAGSVPSLADLTRWLNAL